MLRLGVIGLGRAFMLMRPTFLRHSRVRLVAAADPRPAALLRFKQEFGGRGYDTADALCADPAIDAVYVASPHQHHVRHVQAAAAHGKHVLVEKPMALTIAECQAMIAAAAGAGVHLLVGHSHSYDRPYLHARALIDTGAFGRVRMITAVNYTDFLYRPRRPEELDTAQGGGAVFSQAPHQVEIVRLLAASPARRVRASTGAWDPARPTEGAYAAHLTFENGAFATLSYNGYGRFDTDALHGWIGEMGQARHPDRYGEARRLLRTLPGPAGEAALKDARAYGAADPPEAPPPPGHNHFGLVIVSCEHADIRPTPTGVEVFADDTRHFDALPPPDVPRAEVLDELAAAILDGVPPRHTGAWGLATMEITLAILRSAATEADVTLEQQGPA